MLFIIDSMLPYKLISTVEVCGHKAIHVSALGPRGSTDEGVWEYACSNNAIVITFDKDYLFLDSRDDRGRLLFIRQRNMKLRKMLAALETNLPAMIDKISTGERIVTLP